VTTVSKNEGAAPRQETRLLECLFSLTIFLSAGLVFQVQPIVSRLILPTFGGTPQVWTVCLFFFQALLFIGYGLAFLLARFLSSRQQALFFVGLLLLASFTPFLGFSSNGHSFDSTSPARRILLLLMVHAGLPYLLLCTTGPLLQDWYRRVIPGQLPYRLYAVSNAGSVLGLVTYPILFDPLLSLNSQVNFWKILFSIYVIGMLLCSVPVWRKSRETSISRFPSGPFPIPRVMTFRWFCLAMVPTVLLGAITEKLSLDVSSGPYQWVIPLTLYLISLIICFSRDSIDRRYLWGLLLLITLVLSSSSLIYESSQTVLPLPLQLGVFLALLFSGCMYCHGELVRTRPASEMLTYFYLVMSAGGACGGMFTGLIAPQIFRTNMELPLGMLLSYVLLCVSMLERSGIEREATASNSSRKVPRRSQTKWRLRRIGALLGLVLLAGSLAISNWNFTRHSHLVSRNFYGVIRIREYNSDHPAEHLFEMVHGVTVHGFQFVHEPYCFAPTTYFGVSSGVGLALANHRTESPKKVGIIGLGIGTLAAYAQPGEWFDFYEINPAVIDYAQRFFRYLEDSEGETKVIPGDARLSLEQLPDQEYDILVVDAFGSDAIPSHLLTAEAIQLYLRHLRENGILAVHISNRHVDLLPVLAGHAERFHLAISPINDVAESGQRVTETSLWVLLARHSDVLKQGDLANRRLVPIRRSINWTDDHCSIFPLLKMFH